MNENKFENETDTLDLKSKFSKTIEKIKNDPSIITALINSIGSNPSIVGETKNSSSINHNKENVGDDFSSVESSSNNNDDQNESDKSVSFKDIGSVLSLIMPILKKDLPVAMSKISNIDNEKTTLLKALKPYLSSERQNMVDSILTFYQIGDLFKTE